MTRLRRLLGRDEPPTLIAEMRKLWRVPPTYTVPTSARVVPTRKALSLDEWKAKYAERRTA